MTTKGPLPAATYWRRRVFVVGVALALVFVFAQWLGGGSDGSSDEEPVAEQAVAQVPATETVTVGKQGASASGTARVTNRRGRSTAGPVKPTLAVPDGRCAAEDVAITPSVGAGAEAGKPVTLTLSLQTLEAEACTWQVAPSSVVVTISDGSDRLWTSQRCPGAVPTQSVVVRRAVASVVEVTWNAKEATASSCGRRTNWVLPGDYTIGAAPFGGEPASADFSLVAPADQTIRVTPKAKNTAQPRKRPTEPVN